MTDAADRFEPERAFLVRLAYRMLGSVAEAEDAVQDAFLRWSEVDRAAVENPRAFLVRIVSRLCLDRMKSARAKREQYVGTWLPEPLVEPDTGPSELAADLSTALLMTLERLSPLERAAFLLHDVFDMDYAEIGEVLERSEPAVRQLAARGRDHVRDERPRYEVAPETSHRIAGAFFTALFEKDLGTLTKILAEDAVFYGDGGGKRPAALNPVYGRDKIVRFFAAVDKAKLPDPAHIERILVNGNPGFLWHNPEGIETLSIEISGEQVVAMYGVRNPDKLRHLS